jgi:poly-gamma-glutamate capsule biosynthesis protein CapA/YwtB (metallophosphatase superfamily)
LASPSRASLQKGALALVLLLVAAAIAWRWNAARPVTLELPALPARGGGPLTVVASGDTLLVNPLTAAQARVIAPIVPLLGAADVTLTNLEVNLLEPAHRRERTTEKSLRWPSATAAAAEHLRRIGFNAISLANNHTSDYGPDGVRDTRRILDGLGLHHAGSGEELAEAREPAFVGVPPRRVAMISVSTSSSPEARATRARGDIMGRAGLNPLRYTADVTADPVTFETLKRSTATLQSGAAGDPDAFTLSGTTIKKGAKTVVEFVLDEDDLRAVLDGIRKARSEADAVIVSLHSHEPSNASDVPAQFVRRFAHAAIDAGAALVVGHGPHRIRGVEAYGHGAILYSIGNFIFQYQDLDPRAADVYDAGVDLYGMAIGAVDFTEAPRLPAFDEPIWWEALIARATLADGALTSLELHPIDLGAGLPKAERGIPRPAAPDRAKDILDRLARLSDQLDTRVSSANGLATVHLDQGGVK